MKQHIPNTITLFNLFCGCCAIVSILSGQVEWSLILLVVGIMADYMDGMIARVLQVKSLLGKELDSLSDAVTFGVLPGMMLYYMLAQEEPGLDHFPQLVWRISPVFILSLCAILRLGKFNLDTRQANHFLGLPTPSATIFVAGILAIYHYDSYGMAGFVSQKWFVFTITVALSWLMISDIPMFNFKFATFRWEGNEIKFIFAAIGMLLLILLGVAGPSVVIFLYILFNLGRYLFWAKPEGEAG